MALYGSLSTVRAQVTPSERFAAAFAYVEELLRPGSTSSQRVRGLAAGSSHKVELERGVFVMEQAYQTKARPDGFFESHRGHIDVQVILAGEERMELADAARMTVKQPYNSERDLIVWHDFADASHLAALAGDVAIFFPNDIHMPSLQLRGAPALVYKAVVKVPVG